jgi:hypothetical protein
MTRLNQRRVGALGSVTRPLLCPPAALGTLGPSRNQRRGYA